MIALDTNLLIYAHREDSPFHVKGSELWTADRDFSAFPKLKVRNPCVKDPRAEHGDGLAISVTNADSGSGGAPSGTSMPRRLVMTPP